MWSIAAFLFLLFAMFGYFGWLAYKDPANLFKRRQRHIRHDDDPPG
ncbi:hypothetical protein [Polymorphobacter fuscus]|nr:hypothetical protein [Polymorphobacter fuscus]NJC08119.1 hypothetical protein [Polymorphobacter fuscus]